MALTKEDLQAIEEIMAKQKEDLSQMMDEKLDKRLTPIQADIAGMKSDIADLKISMEEVRDATNYLSEWVDTLDEEFKIHKAKTNET